MAFSMMGLSGLRESFHMQPPSIYELQKKVQAISDSSNSSLPPAFACHRVIVLSQLENSVLLKLANLSALTSLATLNPLS